MAADHFGRNISLAGTVAPGPLPDAAWLPQVDIRVLPQQAVRQLHDVGRRRPLPVNCCIDEPKSTS